MGGSAVRWIPCQRKRGRWLGLKRLLWRSGSSGNASTRICHFSLHSREIGVRLELSYFSEVPWAVLDAANKASGRMLGKGCGVRLEYVNERKGMESG